MRPGASVVYAPVSANLGLRYTLLLKGEYGGFAPIDPSTTVRAGDALQIQFESNDAGQLYLFERIAGGGWRPVEHASLAAHGIQILPSAKPLVYSAGGNHELFAIFTRQPIDPQTVQLQQLVAQSRGKMLLESDAPSTRANKSRDKSVYVVHTGTPPASQMLVFEIVLRIQ